MARGKLWDAVTFGPHRRRRWMLRQLAALDRVDVPHQRSARGRAGGVARAALFVCIVSTGAMVFVLTQTDVGVRGLVTDAGRPGGLPPAASGSTGSYRFSATQPGGSEEPVTYNPCRVIQIEVNDALAPPGGDAVLRTALSQVSSATGLAFEIVGITDRIPDQESRVSVLKGQRDPVLVAWVTDDQVPGLKGDVAGLGGSAFVLNEFTGRRTYVTGEVSLDVAVFNRLLADPALAPAAEAIVLHELAHLVGLSHVDDPDELMFEGDSSRTSFGPGDLLGLAALGSATQTNC